MALTGAPSPATETSAVLGSSESALDPFSSETTSEEGGASEGVFVGGSSGVGLTAVGGTGEASRVFLGVSRAVLVSVDFCVTVAIGESVVGNRNRRLREKCGNEG